MHRHTFKSVFVVVCVYVKSLSVRAINSLFTCPKLGNQRLHLCPTMDTQALSSVQPLPVISSTRPAFTNSATAIHSYRMRRSRQPKMDPFTAEGCRYNQKHSSPSFFSLYTLTLLPSFACSLFVFLFPDAEGPRIHLAIYVSCLRIL